MSIEYIVIQCWDSNMWPSERESPPIITRPGLPPCNLVCFRWYKELIILSIYSRLDRSPTEIYIFRLDRNDRYFNDTWEGLPKHGYTNFFENLILKDPKISVRLDMDYFKVTWQQEARQKHHIILQLTNQMDRYKLVFFIISIGTMYYVLACLINLRNSK